MEMAFLLFETLLIAAVINYIAANETISDNNNTIPHTTSHGVHFNNIRCVINKNCSHFYANTVCVEDRCRCKPNYRWNSVRNKCEYGHCETDEDCQSGGDANRVCFGYFGFKSCNCKTGYKEQQHDKQCKQWCLYTDHCKLDNQVCADYTCKCEPNYKWNSTSNSCEFYSCTINADCWLNGDRHRLCDSGLCVCSGDHYEDVSNGVCYLSYTTFTLNTSSVAGRVWLLTFFIIPCITFYCVFKFCKRWQRTQAPNNSILFLNTNHVMNEKPTKLTIQ